MWPDRVSNLGPLTYESGALPTALRGPAYICVYNLNTRKCNKKTQTCLQKLLLFSRIYFRYTSNNDDADMFTKTHITFVHTGTINTQTW